MVMLRKDQFGPEAFGVIGGEKQAVIFKTVTNNINTCIVTATSGKMSGAFFLESYIGNPISRGGNMEIIIKGIVCNGFFSSPVFISCR